MAKKKNDSVIENDDEAKVTLADFVLPQLVTAFRETYEALDEWEDGCEVFTYTRLRNMFKAVNVTLGDPFILYVQMLEQYSFKFRVDIVTGEFVMYVKPIIR